MKNTKIYVSISIPLLRLFFGNNRCNVRFYFWDCTSQIWLQIQQSVPRFVFAGTRPGALY